MEKETCIILFVLSYIIGIVGFLTNNINIYAMIFFCILVIFCCKKLISDKFAISCLLIFALGFFNSWFKISESDSLVPFAPKNDVTVIGQVISIPSTSSSDFTKFTLKVQKFHLYKQKDNIVNSNVLVTLFADKNSYQNIETGDIISLTGRLALPKKASNPSEFCYSTYLKFKNIHTRLYVNNGNFLLLSKPQKGVFKFLSSLNRLRNKIILMHSQNIKSPQLELLGGIVFGDDAVNPTEDMKNSFRNSGLTHIIAASGMNVSMIFGMCFFLSQIFRLNYTLSVILGMASIIFYTCMTGFGAPVLRASLMLLLILLGKLFNREANSLSLLFIVGFLMLLVSPTMITNIGFQLSFTVTLGLLLSYPLLFGKIKNKIVSCLLSFIFVPLIAQLCAAPIQMFYFNSFSMYSVFANILVVPVLSLVSYLGFISSVLAMVKPVAFYIVKVCDFVLLPFLSYIVNVANFFSDLPHSSIVVPSPSIFQICLYFSLLASIFFMCYKKIFNKKMYLCIFILFISIIISVFPLKKKYSEIIFFDVENADSALIRTSSGKNILIDTGKMQYKNFSTPAERIMLKYFEDNNIRHLDMLILSHYDADHSGGATAILQRIPVSELIVRDLHDKSNLASSILKIAKEKSINIKQPLNNEVLFDDGVNKISAIYSDNGDENAKSIVNIFSSQDNIVLFTGDCGAENFELLKQYFPDKVNVLKVAHHGAKKTVSDKYLTTLKPEIAIISTGLNVYGHPDEGTISTLKKHNVKVFRTDVNNAIKVVLRKNKNLVYSYNNRRKIFERLEDGE
jgi:competence protein ComEC